MISQARLKELLRYDPETGLFTRLQGRAHNAKVGEPTPGTRKSPGGYFVFNIGGRVFFAHRLAWVYVTGSLPPDGMFIDHINGNKQDNRFENLRLATRVENGRNRAEPRHNTSGHRGVNFMPKYGRWRAFISVRGKSIHLGCFGDVSEAIAARLEGERVHFGAFRKDA